MAVFDASWWSVWWPWLLVWGITVVSLVAAVAIAIGHWRRHRASATMRSPRVSFYLDDEAVMDLYHQHDKYKGALRQEVQERITHDREIRGSAAFGQLKAGAKQGVNSEIFRFYIEEAKPITVISIVIDVLDREDDIVDVDLQKKEITANRALNKALGTDAERQTPLRLRDLDHETFVSIRGRFRETDRTDVVTTFEAPYGEPTNPAKSPHVRLTCTATGLRRTTVPAGTFPARCLGLVEDWDSATGRLIVHPIAIFR